jgi:hypothetical protein
MGWYWIQDPVRIDIPDSPTSSGDGGAHRGGGQYQMLPWTRRDETRSKPRILIHAEVAELLLCREKETTMIKQIFSISRMFFTNLFLIVITCLAAFILSGCSFPLDTDTQVINSSSHMPTASLSGYYKIDFPEPKGEERYISVASNGSDYFGELFLYDSSTKKTGLLKGHLLFNPMEDGWYAVSFNYLSSDLSPGQSHFLVKIGKEIEKAVNIHALSDETFLSLADRHGIKNRETRI